MGNSAPRVDGDVLRKILKDNMNDKALAAERYAEEEGAKKAKKDKANVIISQVYGIDDNDDFVQVIRVASKFDQELVFKVQLKDSKNLHWKEAKAIVSVVNMGTRFSSGSLTEFTGKWLEFLKERFQGTCLVDRKIIIIPSPEAPMKKFSNGRIQQTGFKLDDDEDFIFKFRTDQESFIFMIRHKLFQGSIGHKQAHALQELLPFIEPGEKMDESIFLQVCSRMRSKFNLIKTYKNNGTLYAHLFPSRCSVSQVNIPLKCELELPETTTEPLDWSTDTKKRLEENNGQVSTIGDGSTDLNQMLAHLLLGALVEQAQGTGQKPLAKERKAEEDLTQELISAKKEMISHVMYLFDKDGDFTSVMKDAADPTWTYSITVKIADKDSLTWKEVRAMIVTLNLCERGSRISKENFLAWGQQLNKKFQSCVARIAQADKIMVLELTPGRVLNTCSGGRIQRLAFMQSDSSDRDPILVFNTDAGVFSFVIEHQIQNRSYSMLEGKALIDALSFAEPGDKMDESMFLQYSARLKKKYNLVKITRKDKLLVAQVRPTTLTEAQSGLNYTRDSDVTLPAPTGGKIDWSESTKRRVAGGAPASPSPGKDSLPSYGGGSVVAKAVLKDSGQAIVYSGTFRESNGSEKDVALKVFHNADDWNDCKSEIIQLLRVSGHPNVMDLVSFYEVPKPCFVMRLVQGGDLRDYLDKNGPMGKTDAIKVLRGIGEGLKHLHANKIVHRDMKSPNVLLELPSKRPVLIDLGMGKTLDNKNTHETILMKGTVLWMAPEMISENKWSVKTDIFALGIISWEIFSGLIPYSDMPNMNIGPILVAISARNRRPDLTVVESAPWWMKKLMQECWDASPDKRPTAEQFLARLK